MNSNESHTFSESRFSGLKTLLLILTPIFLFFAVVIFLDEMPAITENGLNNSAFLFVLLLIIFSIFVFITFLILSFQNRTTVTYTAKGCDIRQSNFWNFYPTSYSFLWTDITDTNIVEDSTQFETDGGTISAYFFEAYFGEWNKKLLNLTQSTDKTVSDFIKYINDATPHLKYVWEKGSNFGGRQVIVEVYGYSKVART